MAATSETIGAREGENNTNNSETRIYSFEDFEATNLPKIVKMYAKEMLAWVDKKGGWKPVRLIIGIHDARGLKVDLETYLSQGQKDQSPQKLNIGLQLESPNPPRFPFTKRLSPWKALSRLGLEKLDRSNSHKYPEHSVLKFQTDCIPGLYGSFNTLSLEIPEVHYLDKAYMSTIPLPSTVFSPNFPNSENPDNSLFLSLELGHTSDLLASELRKLEYQAKIVKNKIATVAGRTPIYFG